MDNQYKTLIPSKLNYITLLSYQTNNAKLKLTMAFNTFIYNNTIDYL